MYSNPQTNAETTANMLQPILRSGRRGWGESISNSHWTKGQLARKAMYPNLWINILLPITIYSRYSPKQTGVSQKWIHNNGVEKLEMQKLNKFAGGLLKYSPTQYFKWFVPWIETREPGNHSWYLIFLAYLTRILSLPCSRGSVNWNCLSLKSPCLYVELHPGNSKLLVDDI